MPSLDLVADFCIDASYAHVWGLAPTDSNIHHNGTVINLPLDTTNDELRAHLTGSTIKNLIIASGSVTPPSGYNLSELVLSDFNGPTIQLSEYLTNWRTYNADTPIDGVNLYVKYTITSTAGSVHSYRYKVTLDAPSSTTESR